MIWMASVPHVDMSQKPTPMNQGQIAQWLEHLVYIQKVLGSIPSLAISLSHPVCHLYIRARSVLCSLLLSPCVSEVPVVLSQQMKHLSLRLFWLRDAVQDGQITPTFVSTKEMAADIFTKALDRFKVQKCSKMLGLFS